MSEAIRTSLSKLDHAVQVLETAVEQKAKSMKTPQSPQQDLFAGGFATVKKSSANGNGRISPEAVAARLDNAIFTIEELLREG